MASQWNETWAPNSWAASSWWQAPQTSHTAPTWTMPPPPPTAPEPPARLPPARWPPAPPRAAILPNIKAPLVHLFPQPSRRMKSTTTPTWFSSPRSGKPSSHPHGAEPKDSQAWTFEMSQLLTSADEAWKNMDYDLFLMDDLQELFLLATSPRRSFYHRYKRGSARTTSTSTPPARPYTSSRT